MESELNRNLMDKQNQMLTSGYKDAYDFAMKGFMQDQDRDLKAQLGQEQYNAIEGEQGLTDASNAARYGLEAIDTNLGMYNNMIDAANTDRGIQSEAVAADYAQWQQEQEDPYRKLQFMQSMLNGLPISSKDTNFNDLTTLQEMVGSAGGLGDLLGRIFGE
jgi:hypothetical protein